MLINRYLDTVIADYVDVKPVGNVLPVEYTSSVGPGHAKTCLMPYANKKGADHPAHPRSLISTFVVRCLV